MQNTSNMYNNSKTSNHFIKNSLKYVDESSFKYHPDANIVDMLPASWSLSGPR